MLALTAVLLAPATTWFAPAPPIRGRRVTAHYFPAFPMAFDDRITARDYYERQYIPPEGERGKWVASGGMIRERPSASPWVGKNLPDWRLRNMKEEIRRARQAGIDGFDCDILGKSGKNFENVELLLDAAAETSPRFDVLLKPDMSTLTTQEDLIEVVRKLARHPAAAKTSDGRTLLSPFLAERQSPDWWAQVLSRLRQDGLDIAFVPTFDSPRRDAARYRSVSDGSAHWSGSDTSGTGLKIVSVLPQYFRPNRRMVTPTLGSVDYRRKWNEALASGASWTNVVTWNDYSEGTEIAPSTGIRTSFAQLTAYYAAWFRAKAKPRIVRDAVFAFYRPMLKPRGGEPGSDWRGVDGIQDKMEMLAFLPSPARLRVAVGGQTYEKVAPAGMTSFIVPLTPGTPTFSVLRSGKTILKVVGRTISDPLPSPNLLTIGEFAAK